MKSLMTVSAILLAVGCCPAGSRSDSGTEDAGSDGGGDAGDSGPPDSGQCETNCVVVSEQQIYVDGIVGTDGPCCCGSQTSPCRTITYSMGLIQDAGVTNVEIRASNSDGSELWTAPEVWPLTLSNGVTLTAPNLLFNPPGPNYDGAAIAFFLNFLQPDEPDLQITIQGDPFVAGNYVKIGIPTTDAGMSPATIAIFDGATGGRSLRVSNAWIHDHGIGISVGQGAALTLGPLPVRIGTRDGLADIGLFGYGEEGILAYGSNVISDEGISTLHIDSHETEIDLYGGRTVLSLKHGPQLGRSPDAGFSCADWDAITGLLVYGASSVEFGSVDDPATISCHNTEGILAEPGLSADDAPTISFTGSLLNSACWGADIHAGHLQIGQGSQIRYNRTGLWIDGDAGLDVDNFAEPADLSCNGKFEEGEDCAWFFSHGPTGAAVATTATSEVSIRHSAWSHWDDAGEVQTWTCQNFDDTPCECSGADCPLDAGWLWPATADITDLSSDPLPVAVDVSGGMLSQLPCDTAD